MIEAVIFDLDDTLYPEKQFVMSGFSQVSKYISDKYGFEYDYVFNLMKEDFEKGLRKKNFNILLEKLKIENKELKKLIKCYREHKPSISLFTDAKSLLNTLNGQYKLGIITDGNPITQINKIQALGIENCFDTIIINDLSQKISKKNKESFLNALIDLKVKPHNTIYIGDNPQKDFIKSKEIGMVTVRIKKNQGEYCKIIMDKDHEADYEVSDLLEIIQILSIKR